VYAADGGSGGSDLYGAKKGRDGGFGNIAETYGAMKNTEGQGTVYGVGKKKKSGMGMSRGKKSGLESGIGGKKRKARARSVSL